MIIDEFIEIFHSIYKNKNYYESKNAVYKEREEFPKQIF